MKRRAGALIPAALAAAVVALTLYAYRELPARPFAADDYQWLLSVRGLSFGQLTRQAFDPSAQSHFFRPLVWLLFWAQTRAFGLDPRGFHAVSLGLHLVNAGLVGWLAYRLTPKLKIENVELRRSQPWTEFSQFSIFHFPFSIPILAAAIVALHPAPFEAVVWVSAQSELLAAALLLLALHLCLPKQGDKETRRQGDREVPSNFSLSPCLLVSPSPRLLVSTLALGLALLAKESAVIGLPLLMLLGRSNVQTFKRSNVQRFLPYTLPALLTLAYVALQIAIERRNYLLEQGGYGFGPQLLLNPLRSLALIVAPLPATEHADAAWLVPVGAVLALVLIGFTIYDLRFTIRSRHRLAHRLSSIVYRRGIVLCSLFLVLALAWWSSGELHQREWRFAAASGPGGSLWRLASAVCAESRPDRMVLVEPPLAPAHAEAIVGLSCGADTRARIVGRDQIDGAITGHTVVIAFPNGSAAVERRT